MVMRKEENQFLSNSTIEDFRTTRERFENEEERNISQFFNDYSIDSIKPIENKQSFIIFVNHDGPSYMKSSTGKSDLTPKGKNTGEKFEQSILSKLDELDKNDENEKRIVNKLSKFQQQQ